MIRRVILFVVAGLMVGDLSGAETAPSVMLYDGNVLCLRPGHLTEDFAEHVRTMQTTNRIMGTVLDLRFADGDDAAVEAVVKLFGSKKTPLALLVNVDTRGAAAEVAGRLRAANAGILIGTTNLPGRSPTDILMVESAEDERKFQENPFTAPPTNNFESISAKNELLPFVDHMSEAELVRKRIKDGEDEGDEPLSPRITPAQPVIRDPTLARAVDLLKALAILKPVHG